MRQRYNIVYFSGTGNTQLLAELYFRFLLERGNLCRLYKLEDILSSGRFPSLKKSITVLGFPVHAFNAPPNVFDLISRLPKGNNSPLVLFKNAGDPMKNGAFTWIRGPLRKHGFSIIHERSYVMPANTFIKYPKKLAHSLYRAAEVIAEKSVSEIIGSVKRQERSSIFIDLASKVLSTFEVSGARRFGRKIQVNKETCVSCGLCARSCPTKNINISEEGFPDWGNKCTLCMRCLYICPWDSIRPGIFNFIRIHDGYKAKDMIPSKPEPQKYHNKLFERVRKYAISNLRKA